MRSGGLFDSVLESFPSKEVSESAPDGTACSLPVLNSTTPLSLPRIEGQPVLHRVETVTIQIAESLCQLQAMSIPLRNRRRDPTSHPTKPQNVPFPSGRMGESRRFGSRFPWLFEFGGFVANRRWVATILRILMHIHEALIEGVVTTKRDIYYKDPKLFCNQAVVDKYVDDLAYTFGVRRSDLNVVAASKGLVAGGFTITKVKGDFMDVAAETEGVLIPAENETEFVDLFCINWILVVEKEASFTSLVAARFCENAYLGRGIIITSKGYPDLSTRVFLHRITVDFPSVPVLGLVDYDPDGLAIFSTYKYGSISLAHEGVKSTCPSLRLLGVKSEDLPDIPTRGGEEDQPDGLFALSKKDRAKAVSMLDRGVVKQDLVQHELMRQLRIMLMLNTKAGIQAMSQRPGGLERWLERRMQAEFPATLQ